MRTLFILRGAPASGKSTWITQNQLEPYTISTDTLRLMYQSPVTTAEGKLEISQNNDGKVWDMVMELLERRMEKGEFVVIDATHYKAPLINKYKNLVSKYRYRVFVVDFSNISETELKRRNANRGFRKVPDDVIEKMVVALQDDLEVKKSYKIITPSEASKMVHSSLEPLKLDEMYDNVVIFGDIHGCYEPLKTYFEKNPFNERTNYIFCGDYLDRGIQNKEVLEFLISLKDRKNCVFLEGNHEKWLKIYSQKDYNVEDYSRNKYSYKDPFVTKIIAQLKDKQGYLEKKISRNNAKSDELSKLLRESWETNPESRDVYYRFEKVNVPEEQKKLNQENNIMRNQVEALKNHLYILRHEEFTTKSTIDLCSEWYSKEFSTDLSLNINNVLEKNYSVVSDKKENPIKSAEFLTHTYPQIKDIDKTEIRRFCDRLAQMSYFSFNGHRYLVTHGGVPCMPTIKTATNELIKGVGKYEDHDKIDKQFNENEEKNKTWTVQIHGHRNVMRVPVVSNQNMTFNLEGQVEFGGHLRVLELGDFPNGHWQIYEIKNDTYVPEEEEITEEKSDLERLKEMYESKWVQVKELKDNIISFNFTRDAFEKGKWDSITCHARGLFVDKTDGTIVGRSFSKFFNYGEVDETKSGYLKEKFAFPIVGYNIENGFLGIVSKSKGKVHIFTKSSDSGDYVNWFIGCLCNNFGIKAYYEDNKLSYSDMYNKLEAFKITFDTYKKEHKEDYDELYISHGEEVIQLANNALKTAKKELIEKLTPMLKDGYSYVFECVDVENDPHIIKYVRSQIFLLEIFENQLKEVHLPYEGLLTIGKKLGVKVKTVGLTFKTWEEFESWKEEFRHGITQWNSREEGYVFEDQNGYRVKFKSSYYKFWKQMRAVKDALAGGRQNKKIYKTKEEIQAVKLMEELGRDALKNMSIIDVEDLYYEKYPMDTPQVESKSVVTV